MFVITVGWHPSNTSMLLVLMMHLVLLTTCMSGLVLFIVGVRLNNRMKCNNTRRY